MHTHIDRRQFAKGVAGAAMLSCIGGRAAIAKELPLIEIADGVFSFTSVHELMTKANEGAICNLGVIVGANATAVVDSGGSLVEAHELIAAIKTVTNKPVRYLINTHMHPDHIFGNAAFLPSDSKPSDSKEDKPVFVGHAKLADAMQLRKEAYDKLNIKYLGAAAKGSEIVKPTLLAKEPIELDLGDRSLKVTPYSVAHTNTDISVIDSKTQTLFTGDLLFIDRTPVIEGDIKGLIAAIELLKTYPIKQVVPGHGRVTKDWIKALDNEQRYLTILLADIRANIKKGISMESTMDTAAASEKDKWLLFDITNRRNVNTIYPALEWE